MNVKKVIKNLDLFKIKQITIILFVKIIIIIIIMISKTYLWKTHQSRLVQNLTDNNYVKIKLIIFFTN